MIPRVLLIGPPSLPLTSQPDTSGAHTALQLIWHSVASASLYSKVKLSLLGIHKVWDDQPNLEATAEELLPSVSKETGCIYIAGFDPALQAELLRRVPVYRPVLLQVPAACADAQLKYLHEACERLESLIIMDSEPELQRRRPHAEPETSPEELVARGAIASVVFGSTGDLVLSLPTYRYRVRASLLGAGFAGPEQRERVAGGMAAIIASIGHSEEPYLRRALVVGLATALGERSSELGRPTRERVEAIARKLEKLAAFDLPVGHRPLEAFGLNDDKETIEEDSGNASQAPKDSANPREGEQSGDGDEPPGPAQSRSSCTPRLMRLARSEPWPTYESRARLNRGARSGAPAVAQPDWTILPSAS